MTAAQIAEIEYQKEIEEKKAVHKATADLVRLELENMIREKDKLRQVKEQRARAPSMESNDS